MADIDLKLLSRLDEVLDGYDNDIEEVQAEGYSELPDGYYLSSVESATLGESKNSGKLMVSFKCKVVEDGIGYDENNDMIYLSKTKDRHIFKHYVIEDEDPNKMKEKIDKLITDIKKFQDEDGQPLVKPFIDSLKNNEITKSEFIVGSLEFLSDKIIWVNVSTNEKNGQKNTWSSFISFERARKLGIEPEVE